MSRLDAFKTAARPFSIYLAALTVAIGVFIPEVTVDKLGVALVMGGFTSWLRTKDKQITAPPAA